VDKNAAAYRQSQDNKNKGPSKKFKNKKLKI
jgi:hypothetical protein